MRSATGIYQGAEHGELRGERARLREAMDPTKIRAQFEDRELGPWACGWSEFSIADFLIEGKDI